MSRVSSTGQRKPATRVRRPPAGQKPRATNLISELGWTRKRAAQVRASLAAFEEDWNAPGMEEYDKL